MFSSQWKTFNLAAPPKREYQYILLSCMHDSQVVQWSRANMHDTLYILYNSRRSGLMIIMTWLEPSSPWRAWNMHLGCMWFVLAFFLLFILLLWPVTSHSPLTSRRSGSGQGGGRWYVHRVPCLHEANNTRAASGIQQFGWGWRDHANAVPCDCQPTSAASSMPPQILKSCIQNKTCTLRTRASLQSQTCFWNWRVFIEHYIWHLGTARRSGQKVQPCGSDDPAPDESVG